MRHSVGLPLHAPASTVPHLDVHNETVQTLQLAVRPAGDPKASADALQHSQPDAQVLGCVLAGHLEAGRQLLLADLGRDAALSQVHIKILKTRALWSMRG